MKPKTKPFIFLFFSVIITVCILLNSVNAYFGAVVSEVESDTFILSGGESGDNKDGVTYVGSGIPSNTAYALLFYNDTELREGYLYGQWDDNVHIRLYYRSMGSGCITYDFRIYRITSAWDASTVTYDTKPTYSAMLYNYTVTKSEAWNEYEYVYLDIEADLKAVMEESVTYYGYMIYASPYSGSNWINFPDEEVGVNEASIIFGYDEDEGEEEEEGLISSELLINFFMYGVFFIAIPLTIAFYVGGVNSPSLGIASFIGAETLMGAIALSIGFISLWFMIAIIIVDVLLIFAMVKGRGI